MAAVRAVIVAAVTPIRVPGEGWMEVAGRQVPQFERTVEGTREDMAAIRGHCHGIDFIAMPDGRPGIPVADESGRGLACRQVPHDQRASSELDTAWRPSGVTATPVTGV